MDRWESLCSTPTDEYSEPPSAMWDSHTGVTTGKRVLHQCHAVELPISKYHIVYGDATRPAPPKSCWPNPAAIKSTCAEFLDTLAIPLRV
jgi:hypothetical protein